MKRHWMIRAAAFGAGIIMIAGVLVPTSAEETTAGWNDEQAASATMKALTVPAPANTKCTSTDTSLGGPVATISWSTEPSINGSIVSYKLVGKQQLSDPEWSSIEDPTTIPFVFSMGLVGGLLDTVQKLLIGGSEFYIGIVAMHSFQGVTWESAVAPTGKVAKAQGGAFDLIAGFKCITVPAQ